MVSIQTNYPLLAEKIKTLAKELGFLHARIALPELPEGHRSVLEQWLIQGLHGDMDFFERHGVSRTRANYILPGAQSVIMVAMAYWPESFSATRQCLRQPERAYVSRYALGRDYHKVMRARLKQLALRIQAHAIQGEYRPVVDSAPLSEVGFGAQSGLGWRGKNTLLLNRDSGSLYFLGALLTTLPLPPDAPTTSHCGSCRRCIDACPTGAIVADENGRWRVDARRCLSYLTIESKSIVPEEFRQALGNRIYGCDDCQLVCPFNRFAQSNQEPDFEVRHDLDKAGLLELLGWSEADFTARMQGSPIYRIGYAKWLSNILIALGNAPQSATIAAALTPFIHHATPMLAHAARWSLGRHEAL